HKVLQNAAVSGPYVLVGFSIGGLIARLYAYEYPADVVGMVIVDHAFIDVGSGATQPPVSPGSPSGSSLDSPPVLLSSTPITLGLEDDRNFSKLPQRDRDLHTWAMSIHPLRPTEETAAECFAFIESKTGSQPYPLGSRPLIVIRTNNDLPAYERLQTKLLLLSRNSRQIQAARSSHMVIIDEPDVVIESIRKVVDEVKKGRHSDVLP
ncbi:MAG TPA: alpha/beta hydrolase, partial [Candidatus Angelobacter sp.]|nr:alpha/beta hydrolase [Candidatus Angelobacter sp.]